MSNDPALDVLLDYDGVRLELGDGYWVKIEARLVDVSRAVPHGIRYSLTLHELDGKRILGYDNAHAIKPPKKAKSPGHGRAFDHKHRHISDHGLPYVFTSVEQLVDDFWVDVNRVLREVTE